ncbi:CHAT domain-containing protein [Chitinophaga sp. HK235]|uniref:CHAT domain-containing protein n=1 Tax=Chitinophaga sp. HK235 TaxID=2952571 RepID=UPI001BACF9FA|nr:CHAT domain-containing protein [Chitinophaga sp. HK235]
MAEVGIYIPLLRRWLLLIAIPLLCSAFQAAPPDSLSLLLRQYRSNNQLAPWIYAQLQWQASPSRKAALLQQVPANAWRAPQTDEEQQAWLDLLINQGYMLLLSGDIVSSTDAYQQAFEWAGKHPAIADESLVLEYILKPLGNNYTRLGDYEQALFIHQKALALATSLQDKTALAGTYSNLANTSASMGNLQQSLRYCQEGFKTASPNSALYGLLLSEEADALSRLHQDNAARRSIQESIRILQQQPATNKEAVHWLFMAYQQAGDIYLSTPVTAETYYRKALLYARQQHLVRKREQAKLYLRLGQLYIQQRQPVTALAWLDSCATILLPGKTPSRLQSADMYGEYTLLDMLFARATAYVQQQQPQAAMQAFHLCFAVENRLRNEYVSAASKEMAISDSRSRYEAAIDAAWHYWQQTKAQPYQQYILEFMEGSKSQLLWEEMQGQSILRNDSTGKRIRRLEQALVFYRKEALQDGGADSLLQTQQQRISWELATLKKKMPAPVSDTLPLPAMLKLLPSQQVVRSYFAGTNALYTIELDAHGIRFTDRQSVSAQWYDSLLYFRQHFFDNGPQAMINAPRDWYNSAYRIYHQLFSQHPLPRNTTCILMPDGILGLLPIEALVTKAEYPAAVSKWPFLVKEATIAYAYSLRTWQAQHHTQANNSGFSGFFIVQQPNGLPDLKGVGEEKERIAPAINNGTWYLNEQATVADFRRALSLSAVVHISTHAFTRQHNIPAPHIALYDAPFYLFELNGLERRPAMVVLSACGTGDGSLVTGEGIRSMAHAFIAAGTPAVVAASWNVQDATTPRLMQNFYAALTTQPDAAIALQQSKINWLENLDETDLHKLPYYWAALHFEGNTLALQEGITAKQRPNWYWLVPVAGMLIGWLIISRKKK